MSDSPEFTDEDLREALQELGSYVDVTEEDLKKIYALALKHAQQRLATAVSVAEAMTRNVVAVQKDDEIASAVRLLSENRISGLPVIDNGGLVIGVRLGSRYTWLRRHGKQLYLQRYNQEAARRATCRS